MADNPDTRSDPQEDPIESEQASGAPVEEPDVMGGADPGSADVLESED